MLCTDSMSDDVWSTCHVSDILTLIPICVVNSDIQEHVSITKPCIQAAHLLALLQDSDAAESVQGLGDHSKLLSSFSTSCCSMLDALILPGKSTA